MLTKADIKQALPMRLKSAATDQLADLVNNVATDPMVAEQIRENFISYASILNGGRFKTEDYVHAVAYVSYKHMGLSNQEAYIRTFPQRHATLVARGASAKDISSYVAAFSRTKLVVGLLEQTLVPLWLVNQDIYQKAINTQADLMINAKSEKVRSDAANSIMTHLQKPRDVVTNINLDMRENSGLVELQDSLRAMAAQQKDLIQAGATTKSIAEAKLVREIEYEE